MLLPVILAGGSGSRLWPLSRARYPKQFISFDGGKTMLQAALDRLGDIEHQPPLLICNQEHRFIAAEQLRQQGVIPDGILLEPVGRNTAPAIALAAFYAARKGEDPLLLVLAADHLIQDISAFGVAVNGAIMPAQNGMLVTFGVRPTSPETGYGYIKQGKAFDENAYHVEAFVEKPDRETAQHYIASQHYYWNSGLFLFKASRYLETLKQHRADIFDACERAIAGVRADLDFIRLDETAFGACPSDSIDYAVMEKTQDALVFPLDAGWSDLGSFSTLWEVSEKDVFGNVLVGDVFTEKTSNSYIYSQNRLVSTVGVENVVVIETKDAVLVAHKDKVQDVKKAVDQLRENGRRECEQHRENYQPWGSHDEIACGDRFCVKHLKIKPGEQTALQVHYHRAEHWVVVQGTARVRRGDKEYLISENESTYIPLGVPHQIENPGKVELHLIEVRSGVYLGEDDLIRLQEYGVKGA